MLDLLSVDSTTADALEQFVCFAVKPESAQSGILLCSLLLCGVANRSCTKFCSPNEQLMALSQLQHPLTDDPPILSVVSLECSIDDGGGSVPVAQLMLLGGGDLTNAFPGWTETKCNEAVDAAFIAHHQDGVSAFSPVSVHAKVAVELLAAASTSRTMSYLVAALEGWETATHALLEAEEVTAPPPNYADYGDY